MIHFGDLRDRMDKIEAIASHPLPRQHLRVCWENRAPTGNCSECSKCLNTMIGLHRIGQLGHFPVFDTSVPLALRVQRLPSTRLLRVFGSLLGYGLDPELHAAVTALLRRSQPPPPEESLMDRAKRRLRRLLDNRALSGRTSEQSMARTRR